MEVDQSDTQPLPAEDTEGDLGMKGTEELSSGEVDNTADTLPNLFSLTGKAEVALLRWVAVGGRGLQGLLNLRKVSHTTKKWVDDLLPLMGRRLFSSCQVKVDLTEENAVEDFLENPPPPHVTSLSLIVGPVGRDPELWRRFRSFWSDRLESLEINDLDLPLSTRLLEFLTSSTSLRSLRCHKMECGSLEDVPDVLFTLEELSVGSWDSSRDLKLNFGLRLLENTRLEALELPLTDDVDLYVLTRLLWEKKADANLKVKLRLDSREGNEWRLGSETDRFRHLMMTLKRIWSSIRLLGVTQEDLLEAVDAVGGNDKTSRHFWSVVESVPRFVVQRDSILKLADLGNLKRIDELSGDLRIVGAFPPTLQHVGFKGQGRLDLLPGSLTSLTLSRVQCTLVELLESLAVVAGTLPLLETLDVTWHASADWSTFTEDFRRKREPHVFNKLRSLAFRAAVNQKDDRWSLADALPFILSKGFGLPRTPLLKLTLDFQNFSTSRPECVPMVTMGTLMFLMEDPLLKSLCEVDIPKKWVAKHAWPLLESLEAQTQENRSKRRETHGKWKST